jgi:hypothetical protein
MYYVNVCNASGLRVVKHGPFSSLSSARVFSTELLKEREYRGHQAEVFCTNKPHDVSMNVHYSEV